MAEYDPEEILSGRTVDVRIERQVARRGFALYVHAELPTDDPFKTREIYGATLKGERTAEGCELPLTCMINLEAAQQIAEDLARAGVLPKCREANGATIVLPDDCKALAIDGRLVVDAPHPERDKARLELLERDLARERKRREKIEGELNIEKERLSIFLYEMGKAIVGREEGKLADWMNEARKRWDNTDVEQWAWTCEQCGKRIPFGAGIGGGEISEGRVCSKECYDAYVEGGGEAD